MKTVQFERAAEVVWNGDVVRGSGLVTADTRSFEVPVTFPSLRGEAGGYTTPEELLAASHATCYAIGVRSVIARRGGRAAGVAVRARIVAVKGDGAIRIVGAHLAAVVYEPEGIDNAALAEVAVTAKNECTVSNALLGNVEVTCELTSSARGAD